MKKIQGLTTRLCGFDNDHAFPKRTPMYVLGTSVVRLFANWQQHPVSMSHKDRSIIHSKPLENISFTQNRNTKTSACGMASVTCLASSMKLFIIQKGHIDNEIRLLAVPRYSFPMLLQNRSTTRAEEGRTRPSTGPAVLQASAAQSCAGAGAPCVVLLQDAPAQVPNSKPLQHRIWAEMSNLGLNELQKLSELPWWLSCCPLPPPRLQRAWLGRVVCLRAEPEDIAGREGALGSGLVLFPDDSVSKAELSLFVALGKENVCGK